MLYLLIVAFSLLSPFLVRAKGFFLSLRKKQNPFSVPLFIEMGVDAGVSLVLGVLIHAIAGIFFHQASLLYGLFFYLSLCFLFCLNRPSGWILPWIKEKKFRGKKLFKPGVLLSLLVVYLAIDGFVVNRACLKSNRNEVVFNATDSSYLYSKTNFDDDGDGGLKAKSKNSSIILANVPTGARYISLEFESTMTALEVVQENYSGGKFSSVYACDLNPTYASFTDIALRTTSSTIRLSFNVEPNHENSEVHFVLKKIHFDAPISYRSSALRLWLFVAIAFAFYKAPSFARKANEAKSKARAAKITILAGVVASLIALLIIALCSPRGPNGLLADYPIERSSLTDYDIYVKLFDAFRKGQLHLDVDPDPKLVALGPSVYEPSARSAVGASTLWDHVFYEGKYYCYFGAAPVVLVSFPVYWVTQAAATGLFLQSVSFIVAVGGFLYLAVVLTQVFNFRPNPVAYGVVVVGLLFAGLYFNMVCFRITDYKYRIAIDYSLMAMIWFTVMVLEAYRGRLRKISLGFAGFFFAIAMGSRPDFGIWLLFLSPLLVKMLFFQKERKFLSRLLDFVPMLCVLIVCGAFIVAYNVLRFGKIFEFGQHYQITLANMEKFHLTMEALPGSLFHFYLQPPVFRTTFGFLNSAYAKMPFDAHPYQSGTIGLLFNPAFYLIFMLPSIFYYKGKWEWKAVFILLPITGIIATWVLYSFGGTCFRYMLMIFPLSSVAGLLYFASFAGAPIEEKHRTYGIRVAVALSFAGMLFGMNLISVPFDGMRGADAWGALFYGIRDMLGAYNA